MTPRPLHAALNAPVQEFWKARLEHHTSDIYRGRTLAKMPEDLRSYQHLMEESHPDTIIEIGTHAGGSAVWFADQLDVLCGGGQVITVDLYPVQPELHDHRIVQVVGDAKNRQTYDQVLGHIDGQRVMVSEDSAHDFETTLTIMQLYGSIVSSGCWLVIEDGVVDEPDLTLWVAHGVQAAIGEFLASPAGQRFTTHDLTYYGITTNFNGWLRAA